MTPDELRDKLAEVSPELASLFSVEFGDAYIHVEKDDLSRIMRELKEVGFDTLEMVTAVDRDETFVLVYRLVSLPLRAGLFVKSAIPRDNPVIDSMFAIWPAADWQERETFDLLGIEFTGHPDLRRMFLPDDFEGHPLRKDYADARLIRRPDYI